MHEISKPISEKKISFLSADLAYREVKVIVPFRIVAEDIFIWIL